MINTKIILKRDKKSIKKQINIIKFIKNKMESTTRMIFNKRH